MIWPYIQLSVFDIEKKDIDNVNSVLAKLMMISFVFVLLPSVNLSIIYYNVCTFVFTSIKSYAAQTNEYTSISEN